MPLQRPGVCQKLPVSLLHCNKLLGFHPNYNETIRHGTHLPLPA
jgi:hypothetical protein